MNKLAPAALILLATSAVSASETRQLDAHEHGVGQLDVAFDGNRIAMELHAPGADIVGFEYQPASAEDRARVDAAVATLARPLDLFTLPAAAGCSVVQASASLESEAGDDEHRHEDHEGHEGHEEEGHDHAGHAEDSHKDEDHAAHEDSHAHEDHDEDHGDQAGHTEFHAEYLVNCANPSEVTRIAFPYFEAFPNALELEVQVITDRGASAFEVGREAPALDLRDMF